MSSLPTTEEIVAGIQSWVQCESPSNSPQGVAAMAELVQAQASAAGLNVEITPLGPATGPLLYTTNCAPGDTRPGILVLAHLDTVLPVCTLPDNPCRTEGYRSYRTGI